MTRAHPAADWSRLMFDAWRLSADAGLVMVLRSWRMMAGGPPAEAVSKVRLSENENEEREK